MRQEIRLLGEVQVFDGRGSHHPPFDKRLGLLGYLACNGGTWVEREKLAFLFWPDVSEGRARSNLRSLLSRCRNLPFECVFESDPQRVRWSVVSDVAELRTALNRGAWEEAIELYRGELLGGATLEGAAEFNSWLEHERAELRAAYRSAVLNWALERFESGDGAGALPLLERLMEHDPLDEEAAQLAVTVLGSLGRTEAATRLYRRHEEALTESLGLEPSEATKLRLAEATAPRGGDVDRRNESHRVGTPLPPRPLTSFVGRDAELSSITRLLSDPDCRLVSVVGAGGVGKTRFALKAAELLGDRYENGAAFVPLESVSDPQRVPAQLAMALHLKLAPGPAAEDVVIEALADSHLLLVVDNLEQVISSVGFFERLLERCPRVDVIVTTRERTGSSAEWLLPLEGLSLPPEDTPDADIEAYDAVRLFVDRARQVRPDLSLDGDVLAHVVQVSRLTEGLPLALELAAVWLRLLSPAEVAAEIEHDLGILGSEHRSGPARHRSVRAAFERSWSLLSARERQVLCRLAVFRGGFRREAASAVAGATIPLLAALMDKSLLKVDGYGRYDLHPLVQQFLREKLADQRDEERRCAAHHAGYYADLAEKSGLKEATGEEARWKEIISAEYDNLCVAMEWAEAADDAEVGLGLIAALSWYWGAKGVASEPLTWLRRMVAIPGSEQAPALGTALHMAGWKSTLLGDVRTGRELCRRALDAATRAADGLGVVNVRTALADIDMFVGDYEAAAAVAVELVRDARASGDDQALVGRLMSRGLYAFLRNDFETSRECYEEALEVAPSGPSVTRSVGRSRLGAVMSAMGDPEAAAEHLREGLEHARESDNAYAVSICAMLAAAFEADNGRLEVAGAHNSLALTSIGDSGDVWHVGILVHEAGNLAAASAGFEHAAWYWGAVAATFADCGFQLPPYHRHRQARWESSARLSLGDGAFERSYQKGRQVGLWRAAAQARQADLMASDSLNLSSR